jgi:hypothetical protein
MKFLVGFLATICLVVFVFCLPSAFSATKDIIVGVIDNTYQYAKDGDLVGISFSTTSCNAGDEYLDWVPIPDNRHPVIAMNLYRLSKYRLQQIGQSWVKHGFLREGREQQAG